jgi:S-adenosyl methyltransferase
MTNLAGVDIPRPSAARMYDNYLGGSNCFEVDGWLRSRCLPNGGVLGQGR